MHSSTTKESADYPITFVQQDIPNQTNSKLLSSLGPKSGHIVQAVRQLIPNFKSEAVISRFSIHLLVISLVVIAIGVSKMSWTVNNRHLPHLSVPALAETPAVITAVADAPLTLSTGFNELQRDDIILRAAVPKTIIPTRNRPEIQTYVVQPGDTVSSIAAQFGLAPETVTWANHTLEENPDLLRVRQELVILPVDGVYHQVGQEDTLEKIAATFKVDLTAIVKFPLNGLDPDDPIIQPGQWLVVPGGSKPYVPRAVIAYTGSIPEDATTGTGQFGWPTSGTITQDAWSGHMALDIANVLGAPVLAADSGYVVAAGWDDTGYGNTVVIDHGNGFQTLYAHLQNSFVAVGENVAKGQQIASVGNSGNSTGSHTHFEVRQGTIQRNPLGFLP